MELKQQMRAHYLEVRRDMTQRSVVELSDSVQRNLLMSNVLEGSSALLCYVSTGNEVNTHGIIARALESEIAIFVPTMETDRMLWSRLRRFADIDFVRYAPREDKLELCDPPSDAPVIVPGVVFEPQGNRIGRGGGHFDRFLAAHRGTKIGLAFELQLSPSIPMEPHDIPMDIVVTELHLIRCTDPKVS